LDLSSRHGRSAAGQAGVDSSAASPVHESRNRPAVIDASIRGVLVSQIAISVGSMGQVERASPDLFRRSQLVSKTNGTAGLNVDIIESYESSLY
jgi:hypothetical protein